MDGASGPDELQVQGHRFVKSVPKLDRRSLSFYQIAGGSLSQSKVTRQSAFIGRENDDGNLHTNYPLNRGMARAAARIQHPEVEYNHINPWLGEPAHGCPKIVCPFNAKRAVLTLAHLAAGQFRGFRIVFHQKHPDVGMRNFVVDKLHAS